jgi:hypothetical protein
LPDDAPFFRAVDEIVAARSEHLPRILRRRRSRGRRR